MIMKTTAKNISIKYFDLKRVKPFWFLLLGILTMTTSHLSWNIDLLAWISMVPFLVYLNLAQGWKSRITFFIVLIITWSLIVLKIITPPVPYILIPLYSVPIALFHLPGYLIYGKFRGSKWSVLVFPATMVIMEWVQYSFTPLASWGTAAYTQVDSIFIAQTISVFGMAGLGFIIYWFNSAITEIIITKKTSRMNFAIPVSILLVLLIFGYLRFDLSKTNGKNTIQVAAIGTDSDIAGLPLPTEQSNREVIRAIFQRTKIASWAGVKLAVWNEAAFFLTPGNENSWQDSIATLARDNNIAIVASYVVPVSEKPFRFENKFVFYAPDGTICFKYLKHQPVPGEPAVRGINPLISTKLFNSNIGGAICYDYDFPYLARMNKKAGADIVAIPSSDWRGIDPLHTKMAAFRAIEQGYSIIRSTRFGLSAAISPYGELINQMSSFDTSNKIMISNLPSRGIRTIYSYIGDLLVYLCMCFVIYLVLEGYFKNRKLKVQTFK
jgi:apolipoprotein N-acyltransferase